MRGNILKCDFIEETIIPIVIFIAISMIIFGIIMLAKGKEELEESIEQQKYINFVLEDTEKQQI